MQLFRIRLLLIMTLCIAFCGCADRKASEGRSEAASEEQTVGDYASSLFDTGSVHQIDIRISEKDWNDLLANPTEKTKYKVDITIDGEVLEKVSFSTKGNSSLVFVAADPDSSRYSFKVNFGKYVDGQTYRGLNKLSLNNSHSDATCLKDYLSYEIFRQTGVPAPLTSYVWLTVNGNDQGLYLAVEDESESFLDRVNGGKGVIYKPESEGLGVELDKVDEILENGFTPTGEAHGADFVYRDDDPESYPDIFKNAETHAEEEDNLAVIAAMKCLSEGTDPDTCLDTGEIIRYFAAHNFVLNYDSYTGIMLHNMVLLESDGRLSLVPWDYNLAFGTFIPVVGAEVMEDATDILNRGIDTPLIGTDEDSRPMWRWIARDERYRREYHQALDRLVTEYFESGAFDREIRDMREMLLPYVEKDPTAFYSADEFRKGTEVLRQFCERRAESVRKQLDGSLSTYSEDQADGDQVDAGDLRIVDMGAAIH